MKYFQSLIACCVPFIGLSALEAKEKDTNVDRPNIILIMSDQHTANAMSCAGNPYVKTPGIDQLAQDGIRFERSYVTYPLSGPSRASLITGKMPVQLGVKDNSVGDISAEELASSIGNVVNKAGYECLYAGKWHAPLSINLPEKGTGFTNVADMDDRVLVEKSKAYLEKKHKKPIFYVASFLNPHETCEFARDEALHYGPLNVDTDADRALYPPLPINASIPPFYPEAVMLHREFVPKSYPTKNYTDTDWQRYLYAYYRFVERVDNEVLKLIKLLKDNDLYDNSLIIFTSDHGDGVAAHRANQKRVPQEEIAGVPFIVKPPNSKGLNLVNSEALVSVNLDIYKTVCDYANAKYSDDGRFGMSLRPVVEGRTGKHHDAVFVETFLDGVNTRAWTIIENQYKYTLYRFYKNKEQLIDFKTDPLEMQNLAPVGGYADVKKGIREKLKLWGERIDDEMLVTAVTENDL